MRVVALPTSLVGVDLPIFLLAQQLPSDLVVAAFVLGPAITLDLSSRFFSGIRAGELFLLLVQQLPPGAFGGDIGCRCCLSIGGEHVGVLVCLGVTAADFCGEGFVGGDFREGDPFGDSLGVLELELTGGGVPVALDGDGFGDVLDDGEILACFGTCDPGERFPGLLEGLFLAGLFLALETVGRR